MNRLRMRCPLSGASLVARSNTAEQPTGVRATYKDAQVQEITGFSSSIEGSAIDARTPIAHVRRSIAVSPIGNMGACC